MLCLKSILKRSFSQFKNVAITQLEQDGIAANLFHDKIDSKEGSQDNLVIMHGFLGSRSNFRTIARTQEINNLANSYLLDLRNHGNSEHKETMLLPEMALDLKNFILKNDLKNIYLMGHSLGGRVLMKFIQEHEQLYDRIKGIVVVDILPVNYYKLQNPTTLDTFIKLQELAKLKLEKFTNRKQIENIIIEIMEDADVGKFVAQNIMEDTVTSFKWRCNMNAFAHNYLEFLDDQIEPTTFDKKVLVIAGERSPYIDYRGADEFSKIFPKFDAKQHLKWVPNAGHLVHFQQPRIFIKLLQEFLQEK